MPDYHWGCLVCEGAVSAAENVCPTCGTPSSINGNEFAFFSTFWRARKGLPDGRYVCAKCGHDDYEKGELFAPSGYVEALHDWNFANFCSMTCKRCGYVDLYKYMI